MNSKTFFKRHPSRYIYKYISMRFMYYEEKKSRERVRERERENYIYDLGKKIIIK